MDAIQKSIMTRLTSALVVGIILISFMGPAFADEIEDKQRELDSIQKQMEEQQRKAALARSKEQSVMGQIRQIQQELDAAQSQYEEVSGQLSYTEQQLRANTELLSRLEKKLAEQNKILNKRLRDIYKNGQLNYLDVLLGAADFNDFTTRLDLLRRVLAQDFALIESTKKDRELVAKTKAALETDRVAIVGLKQVTSEKKGQVESRRQERQTVLNAATYERATAERAYRELMETSRQIEQMIKRAQSGEKNVAGSTGTMIWPISGEITSNFGWRTHPIFGTQRFHSGIDIGADYGDAVRAADSGAVIYADWMGGYGNAVIIDHGNGISTLYGHNTSLLVSEGQAVAKGTVIARAGSTGYSTGPHVHFEVRQNGSPVNPMSYLP